MIFCLFSLFQGLCKPTSVSVPGYIMLFKQNVSSQGPAPEFGSFLVLPHLFQLLPCYRTGRAADSLPPCSRTHCLAPWHMRCRLQKRGFRDVLQLAAFHPPEPCASRNTDATLPCAMLGLCICPDPGIGSHWSDFQGVRFGGHPMERDWGQWWHSKEKDLRFFHSSCGKKNK